MTVMVFGYLQILITTDCYDFLCFLLSFSFD